jgi:hypothetical protein
MTQGTLEKLVELEEAVACTMKCRDWKQMRMWHINRESEEEEQKKNSGVGGGGGGGGIG